MRKKLISSVACFVLLVVMFVGSSIAWFTDTDTSINTMVAGKIDITQSEKFDPKITLLPGMTVEKIVTVENIGNQPCYVRTLFAFEDSTQIVETVKLDDGKQMDKTVVDYLSCADANVVIPGVTNGEKKVQFQITVEEAGKTPVTTTYTVGYYVYTLGDADDKGKLPVQGSYTTLNAFTIDPSANNAWAQAVGEKYEIIVLSQACQVTGLDSNPAIALNTAFKPIDGESCATWFGYILRNTEDYVPTGATLTATAYSASETNP